MKCVLYDSGAFIRKDNSTVICNYCPTKHGKALVSATHGNTSNLWRHLEMYHSKEYKLQKAQQAERKEETTERPVASKNQPTMTQCFSLKGKYGAKDPRQMKYEYLSAKFIIESLSPYIIVDNQGFKNLISHLDNRINLRSEKVYRTRVIPEMYKEMRSKLTVEIRNEATEGLSLAFDFWKSLNGENFLEIVAVYISKTFDCKVRCIDLVGFNEQVLAHTGRNISETVKQTLEDYEIDISKLRKLKFLSKFRVFSVPLLKV